jgi:hypothetical protein
MFIRGGRTSEIVTQALKDLVSYAAGTKCRMKNAE